MTKVDVVLQTGPQAISVPVRTFMASPAGLLKLIDVFGPLARFGFLMVVNGHVVTGLKYGAGGEVTLHGKPVRMLQ